MVTALRPIEVRAAAVDEVPNVAAVLADALIDAVIFSPCQGRTAEHAVGERG